MDFVKCVHNGVDELRVVTNGKKWTVKCDNEDCPRPPMSHKLRVRAIEKWIEREKRHSHERED